MEKIAFVTAKEGYAQHRPGTLITEDDYLSVAELESQGISVKGVEWSDPSVDWSNFRLVVIRSVWNYHRRYRQFLAWLEELEQAGVRVANPLPVLRWNLHKFYLRALAERGIPIIPTEYVSRSEKRDLQEAIAETGWEELIVKPAVSLGGENVVRFKRHDAADYLPELESLYESNDLLIQEFMPGITKSGEISLVFIGGEFSHATQKVPAERDFRVQTRFGATHRLYRASASEVDFGKALLAEMLLVVSQTTQSQEANLSLSELLYARVDLLRDGKELRLSELELIDPALYLGFHKPAAEAFAAAIRAKCLKHGA